MLHVIIFSITKKDHNMCYMSFKIIQFLFKILSRINNFQNIRIDWFKWKTSCIIFQHPTNLDRRLEEKFNKITKGVLDCSKRELLSENTWSNSLSKPIFFSFFLFFFISTCRAVNWISWSLIEYRAAGSRRKE